MRNFKVATFYHPDEGSLRLSRIHCYTLWYNPAWEGCKIFNVEAVSVIEAKKKARQLRFDHESRGQTK
jgi:hypothetical protein